MVDNNRNSNPPNMGNEYKRNSTRTYETVEQQMETLKKQRGQDSPKVVQDGNVTIYAAHEREKNIKDLQSIMGTKQLSPEARKAAEREERIKNLQQKINAPVQERLLKR